MRASVYRRPVHGPLRHIDNIIPLQWLKRIFAGAAGGAVLLGAAVIYQPDTFTAAAPAALPQQATASVKGDRLPLKKIENRLNPAAPAATLPAYAPSQLEPRKVKTISIRRDRTSMLIPGAAPITYAAAKSEAPEKTVQLDQTAPLPPRRPSLPATPVLARGGKIIDHRLGPVELPKEFLRDIRTPVQAMAFADIHYAALRTGMRPLFMQRVARVESGHRPIPAVGSSAAGPFQFIESTWLRLLKLCGEKHGYKDFADLIVRRGDEYVVKNPKYAAKILALRNNNRAAALMAGEYARENYRILRAAFPKLDITETHLYEAHFFGGDDAVKFIGLLHKSPRGSAAARFPKAAGANRNIFYHNGQALSIAAVHRGFERKLPPHYRTEMLLVSQPRLDQDVATVTLADIPESAKITHHYSARHRKTVKNVKSGETQGFSLWSMFRANAGAQNRPKGKTRTLPHRAHTNTAAINPHYRPEIY